MNSLEIITIEKKVRNTVKYIIEKLRGKKKSEEELKSLLRK